MTYLTKKMKWIGHHKKAVKQYYIDFRMYYRVCKRPFVASLIEAKDGYYDTLKMLKYNEG